ncbi:MAG: TonB-dependent receptor [Chlorobi bacterium]|nr:TonB-dependent receptor [Chlorobiota bacterium]
MKKITITLSILFIINLSFSQVGGLSASKLGTYCVETVPAQAIEFEPAFSFASTTSYFNQDGDVYDLFMSDDSIQHFASTGFRFSYGLFKNFEIGVTIPVDISTLSLGIKYKLPIDSKVEFGLMAGYNGIYGNDVYVKRNSVHESTSAYAFGLIVSYPFSEKLSADFNAQYQTHINKTVTNHKEGIYLSSDIGYYLFENINFITGFSYSFRNNDDDNLNSYLFTLNPGIAIEKAERFILVLNSPIDLFGKNEYKTTGFGLALTILLN